jgi:putative phage-type endonuclease
MNELVQGSDEWFQARLGKVTASRVADVIARTKSGWGAGRANYMAQLIAERLTGEVAPSYTNAAMQWGIDTESQARAAYEFHTDQTVKEIGFKTHMRIKQSGASPDGLVGERGLVEIKCPNTATHIDTLLGQAVPKKYLTQIQWQLACTGRDWCDFVSFDPRMPEGMALWIMRIERDEQTIVQLESSVFDFLEELDRKIDQLKRIPAKAAA